MLRKSTVFLTLFLCILTAFSCSRTPKGVISEKKMKDLIIDVKIAEAMLDFNSHVYNDSSSRINLYNSVFKKHGVTQALYDSSLMWYGKNLEIYIQVFDQAVKEINRQLELNATDEVHDVISVGLQDSVNIWPYSSKHTLASSDLNPVMVFNIQPNVFMDGATTFDFQAKVWGVHIGMETFPEVYICLQQKDTMVYLTQRIDEDGLFKTSISGVPNQSIQKIYGYIYKKPASDYHQIYLDSISLMKYKSLQLLKSEDDLFIEEP